MKLKFGVLLVAFALLAALLFKPFVDFYVDYLWYADLGYEEVFLKRFWVQFVLFFLTLALVGSLFYFHSLLVYKVASSTSPFSLYLKAEPVRRVLDSFKVVAKVFSLLFALIVASVVKEHWSDFLLFYHAKPFGEVDPLLKLDISFYVFRLPFVKLVSQVLSVVWVVLFLSGGLLFLVFGHLRGRGRNVFLSSPFRKYLSVMWFFFFVRHAFGLYLERTELLFDESGVVFGAGFAEAKVVLPAINALILLSLAAALLSLIFAFRSQKGLAIFLVLGYAAVYLLGLKVLPGIVHRYVVQPNELEKESPYIAHEIEFTRKGFGLTSITEKDFRFGKELTYEDIKKNSLTVKNIRLWDHEPLLETYGQIQEIRTYYKFVSVDNDRYEIDGELRQVMLSARELSYEDLPSKSWINLHLIYTHGYGLTVGVVNQVSPEGLPVLLVKDIPPKSSTDSIKVLRPEIYYGELTRTYSVVNTRLKEFDYPSGEENVYTTYQGATGVRVGGIFRRLVFAYYFGTSKFLFSRDILSESRILYYRDVLTRVKRLVPFLRVDEDPYLVIGSDGRLFWMVDLYTTSDRFPYSRRVKGVGNYIRNSAVAVVDAYHGTVDFYLKDSEDPIIRVYQEIFDMFEPLSRMRADLRAHIRYPHRLFFLQARLYGRYHMTDPRVFYNQEDLWEIPKSPRNPERYMRAYYTVMKLPEEDEAEFILMIPFTPAKKHNLSAWMCVRCDPEHYGQMLVYRFPKQSLVYGPTQIESRINQDPEISRQLSLWDQRGSRVILGTLLIIPLEGNLLYVQPLYLKSETGQIPELKRVIVAYGNRIVMERTLEEALARLFEGVVLREEPELREGSTEPQLEFLRSLYLKAEKALKRGDLEDFGRLWKKLGDELLKR